jgi:hypothetical protein
MFYKPTTTLPQADPLTLRHRCRNPKCRGKLKTPVENERDAFCTRGCYTSFYRHRCLKQFPAYLNRWDSQQARNEGVFAH